MSNSLYITQIEVSNQNNNQAPAIIYLQSPVAPAKFEWGSAIDKSQGVVNVANYIIYENTSPNSPATGYLAISAADLPYSLFYNPDPNNQGNVSIILQAYDPNKSYIQNQHLLWSGPFNQAQTFKLTIDLTNAGPQGITLAPVAQSQTA